ncbi:hypothetical protein TNCV_2321741 [Trichonephila clavipes]|nr:hypothetical protein TNCV_2321741 [Trichonephila clavipes]
MSVDFHDAENRQHPCRMIKRHVKSPLIVRLAWMLLAKLNSEVQISHQQSLDAFLWGGNWVLKLLAAIGIACKALKSDTSSSGMYEVCKESLNTNTNNTHSIATSKNKTSRSCIRILYMTIDVYMNRYFWFVLCYAKHVSIFGKPLVNKQKKERNLYYSQQLLARHGQCNVQPKTGSSDMMCHCF